jgi:hypothetical protein
MLKVRKRTGRERRRCSTVKTARISISSTLILSQFLSTPSPTPTPAVTPSPTLTPTPTPSPEI